MNLIERLKNLKTINLYFIFILPILFLTKFKSYLLFHTLVELLSITIAFTIFFVAIVTKKYNDAFAFTFIGISYFFIGGLDIFHTISYAGLNVFEYQYHANQIWVWTRFLEAVSLVIFLLLSSSKKEIKNSNLKEIVTFFIYFIISFIGIYLVYIAKIFPVCFIEGKGQTEFKVISEFIICGILFVGIIILFLNKNRFSKKYVTLMFWSILLTIFSELSFTTYQDNYDIINATGHYFKILSFFLIYKILIQYNLENPFDYIFNSLKEEKDKLFIANKTKEKFFSIIAHDLKNPIYGIKNLLDLIFEKKNNVSQEQKDEMCFLVKDSITRVAHLLEDLLMWSRLQSNTIVYNYEEVFIKNLIEDNILLLKSKINEKRLNVHNNIKDDIKCYCDYNSISTVIRNLLTNAVKFSYNEKNIYIDYRVDDKYLYISIKDEGMGMDKESIDKLFKIEHSFSTPGTNDERGTGLGLILCKEFLIKNNGDIIVESEKNRGSTFTIKLPLNKEYGG